MTILLLCLLAAIIATNMTMFPRKGTALLVLLCLVQFAYFYRWEIVQLPKIFRWLPFLSAGALAVPLAFKLATDKDSLKLTKGSPVVVYGIFLAGMFLLGAMSSMYNGISPIIGVFGLRHAILILIIALLLLSFKCLPLEPGAFSRFVIFVGLFQLPFVIVQRIAFGFLKIRVFIDSTDLTCGTLDDYTTLAFVELFAIGITICHWLRTGKSPVGKNVFVLIGALYLPVLLSNSRAAFLFLAALMLVIAIRHRKKMDFNKIITAGMLVGILLFGAIAIFWGLQKYDYRRDIRTQYSWSYIKDYIFKDSPSIAQRLIVNDPRMGRGMAVVKAWELIGKNAFTLFLGVGPGNTQQSQVFGKNGKYFQHFGPLCGISRHQVGLITAESGIIGIGLYLFLFLGIWHNIRQNKYIPVDERKTAEDIFIVFTTLIAVFSIYSLVLINYGIILFFAYMIAATSQQQSIKDKNI